MTRTDIINALIKKYAYTSYLEIGVQNTQTNFDLIQCPDKTGVDPEPIFYNKEANYKIHLCGSDQFFDANEKKFDIIFIDGLHIDAQVYKDILNALQVLNENGTIVCHDMNPLTEAAQKVPRIQGLWNGDCWKAFVRLRMMRRNLIMFTIDTDQGCGIIQKGMQKTLPLEEELFYAYLAENRKNWLNLISIEEFNQWLNG